MAVKYFSFKGTSSVDFGILERYPHPPKAAVTGACLASIPGRAEPVYIDADMSAYQTVQIQLTLILHTPSAWYTVYAWLSGRGRLIIGDDPDHFYYAHCDTAITPEYINRNCGKIPVSFTALPFRYMTAPETITLTTSAATVENPGNIYAEPVITIYGTGNIDLHVNGDCINLYDIEDYITLDTPRRLAYREQTVILTQTSRDFLPMLCVGNNIISWVGDVSSVSITPNWRWI